MNSRFTIARMHRDPHTQVSIHRESFPQFFTDATDAISTLSALNQGENPDFFQPGHAGVFLEIHQYACDGHALHRMA